MTQTETQPCAFMAVTPIWLRPWVWLQLWVLRRWVERHQQAVFLVMESGTYIIRIQYFGDVAIPAKSYTYSAPAVAAWERPAPHDHLAQSVTPELAQQICAAQPGFTVKRFRNPGKIWDPWRNTSTQSNPPLASRQTLRTQLLHLV